MQNIKNFSNSLLSLLSSEIVNNMSCVSSNGTRISEIDNRLAEIKDTLDDYQKKLQFIDFGMKSGMLEQSKLDELNQQIDSQATEITAMQAEKISLETEKNELIADSKGKYRLFDSNLRNAITCGEKSTPKAYKIKQAILSVLIAIENLDDDDLEDVDDDDVELGVKSAITHHYTERSCKSGRYNYVNKFNLEDSPDAVKESLNTRLASIVNPLK